MYVTTFPEPGSRIRVSTNGAMLLRWARKANEIVYFDGQRRLIAVPVRTGTRLELGEPRVLFTAATRWLDFDVTPDGSRIVAVEARNGAGELPMTVLTRWPQTLEH